MTERNQVPMNGGLYMKKITCMNACLVKYFERMEFPSCIIFTILVYCCCCFYKTSTRLLVQTLDSMKVTKQKYENDAPTTIKAH